MTVFELTAADDSTDVWDVVTFTDGDVTYDTGDARSLVEARLRVAGSRQELLASLDGWSNGYVSMRRRVSVADRVTAGPVDGFLSDGGAVQAAAGDPDAARIQQQWDTAKARLLKRWPKLAGPMVDELADQAGAALEAGDLALLGDLQVSAGVIAAVAVPLRKSGTDLAVDAAAGVVEEAAAQGANITVPDAPGRDRIVQHADAVARIIANGYASGAAKTALQLAGAGPADVRAEVERHLTELGESVNGLVGENVGALLSAAQFAGRLAVLEEHPASSYVSVEANDRNRCGPCSRVNSKIYPTLRAALADYAQAGQYKHCEGRARCRGFVRPKW